MRRILLRRAQPSRRLSRRGRRSRVAYLERRPGRQEHMKSRCPIEKRWRFFPLVRVDSNSTRLPRRLWSVVDEGDGIDAGAPSQSQDDASASCFVVRTFRLDPSTASDPPGNLRRRPVRLLDLNERRRSPRNATRERTREEESGRSTGTPSHEEATTVFWSEMHRFGSLSKTKSISCARTSSVSKLEWTSVVSWPMVPSFPVLGIDPDVGGALAIVSGRHHSFELRIHDVPTAKERVGSTLRRRHCPKGISLLLKGLELPPGSVAYVEAARPMPQNGRQGWYGSGFGYGVWLGALAAHGIETVSVQPNTWKKDMMLTRETFKTEVSDESSILVLDDPKKGKSTMKDRSREIAAYVFPQVQQDICRKKDHGRAEALLLAAWGCGMRCKPASD